MLSLNIILIRLNIIFKDFKRELNLDYENEQINIAKTYQRSSWT